MASDEFYKKLIRKALNRDKIKLWELPYTNEDGSAGSIPQVSSFIIYQLFFYYFHILAILANIILNVVSIFSLLNFILYWMWEF